MSAVRSARDNLNGVWELCVAIAQHRNDVTDLFNREMKAIAS
jgi:hypothetical protein